MVGLARVLGVLLHGGGQFLHRGGGFFQAGGLLLGTPRQVVVAGGDLAGCGIDAERSAVDAADDAGQLLGGGVGIVTHAGEHAVEVAVHACGQIAGSDGLQHRGQGLQVAVGGGHQLVEAVDHGAEVVLEALRIAAHAEVAGRRGGGELADLAVHRGQVLLDRIHGRSQCGLLAGQTVHVLAEVADRIAVHDLRQAQRYRDLRRGQRIAVADHASVVAGERALVHAVADLAGIMALRHLDLRREHALQLQLHLLHVVQQLAAFVAAGHRDRRIQATLCDLRGNVGGTAYVAGQCRQGVDAQGHDQQRQQAQPGDRPPHRAACVRKMLRRLLLQGLQRGRAQRLQRLAPLVERAVPAPVGIGRAAVQCGGQLQQGLVGAACLARDGLGQRRIGLLEQADRLFQFLAQSGMVARDLRDLLAQHRRLRSGLRRIDGRVQAGQRLAGIRAVDQAGHHQVVALHIRGIDQLAVVAHRIQRAGRLFGERAAVAARVGQRLAQARQGPGAVFEAGQGGDAALQVGQHAVRAPCRFCGGAGIDTLRLQRAQQRQHLPQRCIAAQFIAADADAFIELFAVEQQRDRQPEQGEDADDAELPGDGEIVPGAQRPARSGGGKRVAGSGLGRQGHGNSLSVIVMTDQAAGDCSRRASAAGRCRTAANGSVTGGAQHGRRCPMAMAACV